MGPCKPDKFDGLTCGSDNGAARVVDNTISPSKRLALAWRATGAPPTDQPGDYDDDIEVLIVRLADGGTGDTHVNHVSEFATWSPDSRFVIDSLDGRYETDSADVYALAAGDAVSGPFDLLHVLDPAICAEMKSVKDADSCDIFISLKPAMTIDNDGLMHATVMMGLGKLGPERYYNVTAQIARGVSTLHAKALSVSLLRVERQ
jgi:hypothetical protein